jgi:hypothetical protein
MSDAGPSGGGGFGAEGGAASANGVGGGLPTGGAGGSMPTGGAGGGTGGTTSSSCPALCAFYSQCGSKAACDVYCQVVVNDLPECEASLDALTQCIGAAAPQCYDNTTPVPPAQCAEPSAAWNACGSCVPQANINGCQSCSRSACCAERKAYYGHSQALYWLTCATPCGGDPACEAGCWQQYPSLKAAYDTLSQCMGKQCGNDCYCQAAAGDTSCTACRKQNCCSELAAYFQAPDVQPYSDCLDACGGTFTCHESCSQQYPQAGNAMTQLLVCDGTHCTSEC